MAKDWTTKEIAYIKKSALLAETNQVLNIDELAKKLGRSSKAVEMKIYKMRLDGQLPKTDYTKSRDVQGRAFSPEEDKRIIAMYNQNETYDDIGNSLGRTGQSIGGRIVRLKKIGKIKGSYGRKNWTEKEVKLLLKNIRFDENGYCNNHAELCCLLNKSYHQVAAKIGRLRKEEQITTVCDRTKTSVKSKESMDRFNCARFGKRTEAKPVSEDVSQTNIQIDTQSKVVQMIMTTVTTGTERITNFFTMDGELLTVKKEPTSSDHEVSH